jgi:diacylglycerol kinase family enzyme
MRILVANSRSGAVRRLAGGRPGRAGRHAAEAALRRALDAAGAGGTVVRVVPPRRIDVALRVAAQEAEELWVAGGDGTLRAAAGVLLHTGKPLGVVPLGTMNLLARDLAIPLDLAGALRALAEAPIGQIDVGRMNDALFLNKSALGLYPEMIIDRERRQRLWGYGKWPAMLRAMWRALRRNRLMELTLEAEGASPRHILSPAVVVATNAYEFRAGRLFRKPELASGELTAYISHEKGWMGTLGQFAKLFLGTLERDPELEVVRTHRLIINFTRSRPVANDGEVEFVRAPVCYSVEPRALTVRWPGLAARDGAA